ncbi:non-ribosomal peptide synthetase, partial [Pectobacterium atrosepticum]
VRGVFSTPVLSDMAQAILTHQDKPALVVPPNRIPADSTTITPDLLPLVTLTQPEIDTVVDTVSGGAANVQDIYPLSPLQEGILFHHQMQKHGDAYLLRNLAAFDTREHLDAFLTALQQVIERHDILRTAVCWQGLNQPVQVVWRRASLQISHFEPASPEAVLAQLQAHTDPRTYRVSLNQAPLFQADIAHDPKRNEWLLALRFHHLVCDHMTLALIIGEIRHLLQGQKNALPTPLPYRNFIYQTLNVPTSEHEAYFRERLADIDAPTAPFGVLDVQGDGDGITEAYLPLETVLASAIRSQARRFGVSPSVLFHVAWAQVLAQTSGRDDVVFGSVLLGRLAGTADADRIMGMFINTLPLRISLADRGVAEVVEHTSHNLMTLLEHEQASLALAQRCSGVTPPMPLFSTLFNYRHSSQDIDDLAWSGMRLLTSEERTNYPLILSVNDRGNAFSLEAQAIEGIDPERVVNYLITALSGLTAALETEPQRPIRSLSVLPESERQQLLIGFNATDTDSLPHALIHERIEHVASQTPDAVAVIFGKHTLSYDQLNRRANRLAHHLLTLGVQPDDRIAICVERGLEMIVGLLGILKAGAAYVPLDPSYPVDRLTYMLEDAAPVALLTQTALVALLDSPLPVIELDNLPAAIADETPDSNPTPQSFGLTPNHLAYVIYTSGSTGKPKGVMVEHRNLCNLVDALADAFNITRDSRLLQFASFSFDACVFEVATTLSHGGCLVLAPREALLPGEALLTTLKTQAVTHALLPPIAASALPSDAELPLLKTLILGGEACTAAQVKRWASGRRVFNAYGPTEITVCATLSCCDASHNGTPPIGRPIANTQIYILDEQKQPVPLGVAGEIYIGGAGVARGYLNRPELTAERFIADPFTDTPDARLYKTGDLGRWLPNGDIDYLGRNDFQIKLRGFRIELGEIETHLIQCSGVGEAVVIAREDSTGDARLVAYLCPQPGAELHPTDLRQQLSRHLAEYMVPSAFVVLDVFPLTSNGKLDRNALPAPGQTAVARHDYEAPQGELEIALAQIWQDLLGLDRVGRHDQFFELGGHSLIIVRLIERLRNLGWTPEARSLFSTPVLCDMAQEILANQDKSTFIVPPNRIAIDATAITPELLPLVTLSQEEIDTVIATVPDGVANVQDIYPLAPLQEGILFHYQLQEKGDTYLLNSLLAFDSQTRLDAFLDVLQQVIARHDILRTAICWQGLHQPVQVVWRQAPLTVNTLTTTSSDTVPTQLRAATDPSNHRLNLSHAPLLSATTAHDPVCGEWLLSLSIHHLISDHITQALIIDEIRLLLEDRPEALPKPLPYRNFIAQILSVPLSEHEQYFRNRLADIDTPTAPFDLVDVQGNGEDITEARLSLDSSLADALRRQARHLGISSSVLFHVAWAQVLALTSGRDDVVFGSVLSGRLQGNLGADRVMGMFINTLPLRVSLRERSVHDVVQATSHELMMLLAHEQAPLALAQQCSQVPPPLPLFSTLFNYRHSQKDASSQFWEGMRQLSGKERTNYPITLSVDDLGDGFNLTAKTVMGVDPERIVHYMLTAIENLVTSLEKTPQQPALSQPILPKSERQQVLVDFNATDADFPREMLIQQRFEAQAEQTPEAIAVLFEDQHLTYRELNRRANQLAHHLIALGVQPDDRVALCVERSLEMMVGLLGILKAGAAYVPMDPAYPAERLAYILDDAAPVALLTQSAQVAQLNSTLPTVLLDTPAAAAGPDTNPVVQGLHAAHLAYVIYTSGSTGRPKGVMVAHRNVINLAAGLHTLLALDHPSRIALNASIVFDASVKNWIQLLSGHTLVLVPDALRADAHQLWRYFARHAVDLFDCTPVQLQWLLDAGLGSDPAYQPAQVLIGGEAISPAVWSRLQSLSDTRFINVYGPTECTVDATACVVDRTQQLPTIGKPLANTRLYILDAQDQPVPIGVTGELHIGGAGVARGYLHRPDLTAERFIPDPFSADPAARIYKTGDLARWLPDGNIDYLGRNDFQIKVRGFRIEAGEIESRLLRCPGVQDAVVIAREDSPGDTRLVAYLCARPDAELHPAALRQQLAASLADYMIPSAFVTLDALPLTPNGKLDRKALPAPDQTAFATRDYEAPQGGIETALAALWQELLGLDRVGRHDQFFTLGGHSLLAVQLLNRMNKA